MRIAVVGDLHLSDRSHRYQHELEVLDWCIDDALNREVEMLVLAGDVFENLHGRPSPSPAEYDAVMSRVKRVTDAGVVVGLIRGNHEHPDALEPLRHVSDKVKVASDKFVLAHAAGGTVMLLVPYPRLGRPPYDGLGTDATADAAARIEGAVFAGAQLACGGALVVVTHATLAGMGTRDAEFEQHSSREPVLPLTAFSGAALTMTGHIHRAQQQHHGDGWDAATSSGYGLGWVLGVGSPLRHSFAEAEDQKSYLVVEVDGGAVKWSRVETPARGMAEVRDSWPSGDVEPSSLLDACGGKEVKLVVEVDADHRATFDSRRYDALRTVAAHFVLEVVVVRSKRVRAPEMAVEAPLGHQLREWARVTDKVIEQADADRLDAKLDALIEKVRRA